MADKALPCPTLLRQLLRYDPETGKLFWKRRSPALFKDSPTRTAAHKCANWNAAYDGKEAFTAKSHGYPTGAINNQLIKAHRVIWAITHGAWPKGQIDHINGVRWDNRIANLRDVSLTENLRNMPLQKNNTSGVVGVLWYKQTSRWQAQISHEGKSIHLGFYRGIEEASAARRAAEIVLGYHKNHGRA